METKYIIIALNIFLFGILLLLDQSNQLTVETTTKSAEYIYFFSK